MTNDKLRGLLLAALMVTSVFAGTIAFAGTAAAANNLGTKYQGEDITFSDSAIASGDSVEVYLMDGDAKDGLVAQYTADSSGEVTIETADLDAGSYGIFKEGSDTELGSFSLVKQRFSVSVIDDASDTVDNKGEDTSTTFDISSQNRAGDFMAEISADGLTGDELEMIFGNGETGSENSDGDIVTAVDNDDDVITVNLNKNDDVDADFVDIDAGEYELNFTVTDTTAEDSVTVTVNKGTDSRATIQESAVSVESGDTGTFTVNLRNTNKGWIQIGDDTGSDSVGFQVVAQVEDVDDDGVVNVSFNTYGPSDRTDSGLSVDGEDEIVSGSVTATSGVSDRLDTGNYPIASHTDKSELDSPQDVATFAVTERATTGAQSWVANAGVSVEDADDVAAAIEDGDITQGSSVADGDTVVVQVQASGIYGYLDANTKAQAFDADDGALELTIEQTNPAPNTDGATFGSSDVTLIQDDDGNNLFIVMDTTSVDVEDGDEFNATFAVKKDSALANKRQQVSTNFEVVESSATLDTNDDDVVEVPATANATVSGTSTLAPGSQITVRVQSVSGADNPFVQSQTVNVTSDGTFSSDFNFADKAVGTNFTATVSAGPDTTPLSSDSTTSWDGTIVEAVEQTEEPTTTVNTTTTAEPTTEQPTTTAEPTTEQPTETPDEPSTTTTTSPGFGIAVALVALAGAALLALRREN